MSAAEDLLFIISYAGSEAGRAALSRHVAEVDRLRLVEAAARDAVNVSLNDAGPEAFATMAHLRSLLVSGEGES